MLNAGLLGLPPEVMSNPLDLSAQIEAGLSNRTVTALKQRMDLTDAEMGELLDISSRTLHRLAQRGEERLSLSVSDRIYRLVRVLEQAEDTFPDAARAHQWLREPQYGLNNEIPLRLLRTEVGTAAVMDLLGRIAYGVYS